MSEFVQVVIDDEDGDQITVDTTTRAVVYIGITEAGEECGIALTVDQCAALIAAITDAARVVTGEKA